MRIFSIVIAFFSLFSRGIDQNNPAEIAGEILEKTARFAHKKYPLRACGTGMMMPGGIVKELALCFQTKTLLSRDKLRILLIECGKELIQQINSDENIQRFLIKKPFTMKEARIIIYNKDKQGNESYDPLIATAEISEGILTFFTTGSKETWTYKNEFEETYEEALEIVNSQQNKARNNTPPSNEKK